MMEDKNNIARKLSLKKVPEMSKIIVAFISAAIIICTIFLMTGCLETQVPKISLEDSSQGKAIQNTISVTGMGSIKAVPDEVFIQISVITEKPTTQEAVSENSEISNQLKSSLESIDAENLKIQAISYELIPLYDYSKENQPPQIYAYQVVSTIEARTTDLKKIGEIIAKATEKGAGRISSIGFDLTDEAKKKAKNDALAKAAGEASDKAAAVAGAMGLNIDRVLYINESETTVPGPFYAQSANIKGYGEEEAADVIAPVISPQEIEVTAYISITYLFSE